MQEAGECSRGWEEHEKEVNLEQAPSLDPSSAPQVDHQNSKVSQLPQWWWGQWASTKQVAAGSLFNASSTKVSSELFCMTSEPPSIMCHRKRFKSWSGFFSVVSVKMQTPLGKFEPRFRRVQQLKCLRVGLYVGSRCRLLWEVKAPHFSGNVERREGPASSTPGVPTQRWRQVGDFCQRHPLWDMSGCRTLMAQPS